MKAEVARPVRIKREISGVLLLDKPGGISSNQALQIAKRFFCARKAGHTGTLDPMATGLLPICLGDATRFSSALLGADKTYEATLRPGYISTTGDAEGNISVAGGVPPQGLKNALPQVKTVLGGFTGLINQVPPMYSALKHRGKPMYAYAREGMEIERQPREVTIHELRLTAIDDNEISIMVRCGSGTYIRTLAEDIGKALGLGGAYLTALRRTILDDFDLSQAYTLDALEAMSIPERDSRLLPVDALLRGLPAVMLEAPAAAFLRQGRSVAGVGRANAEGQKIRLYDEKKNFLGLGEVTAGGDIAPKKIVGNVQKL
ncbi:tRNA pseudouridine(55) synthase TruB [Nitrosospira sp. Is2]|nr:MULTISPECIES: tRNA pseudouridine(55) synthase TruB [unclassified Nitrosospira]WON74388.1 tRNA pseudouridine(55) synthase TruB [Nitrosospira sp. Is2]